MNRALLLCVLACFACDDPPHDQLLSIDGGQDLSATTPDDLPLVDLSQSSLPPLVTTGHYFLAEEAQSGTLYGAEIIAPAGLSPIKMVSIATDTGAVTQLYSDSTAIINIVHTSSTHLYWLQHDTFGNGSGLLRWVKLDGSSPATFFDATIAVGVPAGYLLQNFVVTTDSVIVLLSDGMGWEAGKVPKDTGTGYTKIGGGTYAGATSVVLRTASRDNLAVDGTTVYAGGVANFSVGSPHGFIAKITSGSSTLIWDVQNTTPRALIAAGGRLGWSDAIGGLFGYDGAITGKVGDIDPSVNQLTVYAGSLYGAGYTTPPPVMMIEKMPVPTTFSGNAKFMSLRTIGECLDVDMGCIAKSPTFAIDSGVLYHTTTDGVYRLPL